MRKLLASLGFPNVHHDGRLRLDWPEVPFAPVRGVIWAARPWVVPMPGVQMDHSTMPNVMADVQRLKWRFEEAHHPHQAIHLRVLASWPTFRIMARLVAGTPLAMAAADGDDYRLRVIREHFASERGMPEVHGHTLWIPDGVVVLEGDLPIASGRQGLSLLVVGYQ